MLEYDEHGGMEVVSAAQGDDGLAALKLLVGFVGVAGGPQLIAQLSGKLRRCRLARYPSAI